MFLISGPWHCFQCQEFGFSWNFALYKEILPQAEWLGGEVWPSPSSLFCLPHPLFLAPFLSSFAPVLTRTLWLFKGFPAWSYFQSFNWRHLLCFRWGHTVSPCLLPSLLLSFYLVCFFPSSQTPLSLHLLLLSFHYPSAPLPVMHTRSHPHPQPFCSTTSTGKMRVVGGLSSVPLD